MSSRGPSDRFAAFFPAAPSVLQQKRKRSTPKIGTDETASNTTLTSDTGVPSLSQNGKHEDKDKTVRNPDYVSAEYEEKATVNGDTGDLLNGVGSASSLTSTVSSVFSNSSQNAMQTHQSSGAGSIALTPLTNHEYSPPDKPSSPRHSKAVVYSSQTNGNVTDQHNGSTHLQAPDSDTITPAATPPSTRVPARPGPGEAKGLKAIYDPELDQKLSSKDKKKLKIRYRKFGEEVSLTIGHCAG